MLNLKSNIYFVILICYMKNMCYLIFIYNYITTKLYTAARPPTLSTVLCDLCTNLIFKMRQSNWYVTYTDIYSSNFPEQNTKQYTHNIDRYIDH